ncbi:MAG: multiple sugar transport system substrate-binding protein [Frankiales bacterium]|jgi:multiple sugar transport system substrate-binding protein|nr:multiple sugar transport system substrate-binding protein [Frankiales bacterium]
MGDEGKLFPALVKQFTASTGIKVKVESIPWDNVNDKLTTAVASGNGPDVLQVGLSNLATFKAAGALKDLTSELPKYPHLASDNFVSSLTNEKLNPDGHVVNVPWVADTRVLFYRSDLLTKAGIAAPPSTWTDLHADAVKLAAAGGKGKYGYYIPQWDQALPNIFTWQAGGEIQDSSGKVTFASAAAKTATDFYESFYADKLVPTNADFDQTQGFVSGAAPMLVSGPYLEKAINDAAPQLKGKWSVAPLPAGQSNISVVAGSSLGVWKNSKNLEADLQLLDYLDTPSTQVAWFKAANELPSTKSAFDDPALTADPMVAVYAKQLGNANLLPLAPKWGAISAAQLKALNNVALQHANEAKELATLNSTVANLQK